MSQHTILQNSSQGTVYQALWQRVKQHNTLCKTIDELLERTKNEETFATAVEVTNFQFDLADGCNIVLTDGMFHQVYFGFPVPKDFLYIKEFNNKYVNWFDNT